MHTHGGIRMSKLLAIGEALIDFLPTENGKQIKDVISFEPKVGGAPANVCGAFSKMGDKGFLISKLGMDPFADKILDEFKRYNIQCDYIKQTDEANTSLAFVALKNDGDREFSFFRNPGADMLLKEDEIEEKRFEDADILHFCSVSLGEFPMKYAHKKAIEYAKKNGLIISFDPNLRFPLWKDKELLRKTVREFIPMSHIVKISDEELEFITGKKEISDALEELFVGDVKLVIYTKGKNGAECYTKNASAADNHASKKAVDTTGAGDAFIGSFLWQLANDGIGYEDIETLSDENLHKYIEFSNKYSAASVMKYGAISSYPGKEEIEVK